MGQETVAQSWTEVTGSPLMVTISVPNAAAGRAGSATSAVMKLRSTTAVANHLRAGAPKRGDRTSKGPPRVSGRGCEARRG